jgi:flagellar motility protein MotE (MotC chaperone)
MKKLVLLAFIIVVLFSISAGASWLLRNNQQATHKEHTEEAAATPGKGQKGSTAASGGLLPQTDLKPAVRPSFNPEADSAAQLANNLRVQTEALRTREQQLIVRQKGLEIIFQDMRGERAIIDDMKKQLSEELKALSDKVESLERKSGEVDSKQKQLTNQHKQLKDSIVHIEDTEKDTVKRLAVVYDSMDSEAAAQQLQHMADTGKMETAVKILTMMRERQAAKVLAAFTDRTTVSQFIEKMTSVDRTPSAKGDKNTPPTGGN